MDHEKIFHSEARLKRGAWESAVRFGASSKLKGPNTKLQASSETSGADSRFSSSVRRAWLFSQGLA